MIDAFFKPSEWLLNRFTRLNSSSLHWSIWIIVAVAIMAFPAAFIRAAHYEEGTVIGLARGAFEDGHWLTPHLYSLRYVERPALLSWIIALFGELTGGVTILTARAPHFLFLLAGGFLVYDLIKSQASKAAGLFGALCWFTCPMMAQRFITAEPDVTLSVLLFSAFYIWWKGHHKNGLTLRRWVLIGIVLAAAGLTKGPQPIAYFTLGIGTFLLLKRSYDELPGFILSNFIAVVIVGAWYAYVFVPDQSKEWAAHSRLFDISFLKIIHDHIDFLFSLAVEWLPFSILLIPIIFMPKNERLPLKSDILLSLSLYAGMCTLVLLLWPGGVATRYALPATPALAVIAGLLFDKFRDKQKNLLSVAFVVTLAVGFYQIVLGWVVMPLASHLFQRSEIAARTINETQKIIPGTVYGLGGWPMDFNVLAHVSGPIKQVSFIGLIKLTKPALVVISPENEAILRGIEPDIRIAPRAVIDTKQNLRVVEINHRPNQDR